MLPYIVVFLGMPFCAYKWERLIKNNKKREASLFFLFMLLIPSIVASCRASIVGIDGRVYVEPVLQLASKYEYNEFLTKTNVDFAFASLLYFISMFSTNIGVSFFIIELIIVSLVSYAAYLLRDKISIFLYILIFALTLYTKSLNLMRQCIGISFFMVSIAHWFNKKKKKSLIYFFIGMLFHRIVLVFSVFYLINIINSKIKKTSTRVIFFIILILVSFVIAFNIQSIVKFLVYKLSLFPERYYLYFNNISYNTGTFSIVFRMCLLLIMILVVCRLPKNNETFLNNITMLELAAIGVMFNLITFLIGEIGEIYRLSYALVVIAMMYVYPQIFNIFKKNTFHYIFIIMLTYGIYLIEWIKFYVISGDAHIYPYIFR